MDNTLYIVSGCMRTGTSMMMRALEAGGMDAAYKQSRDVMKERFADEHYDPNVGGLYELERRDYREPGFPHKYEGRLIKALAMGVPSMAVMERIRVVFMQRHPEEIRQSYGAFFGQELKGMDTLKERTHDILERIRNRRDVISLEIFWYRDVIESPHRHFQNLYLTGWPINTGKAAAVVDPDLCRYRLEHLTVGVL